MQYKQIAHKTVFSTVNPFIEETDKDYMEDLYPMAGNS
jgi:hypothetical protein